MIESCYIYQTIHTLAHHALHVEHHCRLLERSFLDIFFRPITLNCSSIEHDIRALLTEQNRSKELSQYVELRIDVEANIRIVVVEQSIYEGYVFRAITPTVAPVTFDSPFGLHSSSARRAAICFADDMAHNQGCEMALECRRVDGENQAIAIQGGAIFGVINRTLIASVDILSVERMLVLEAAKECNMEVVERCIMRKELTTFDELFFVDHHGVTAISQYQQQRYMSIMAENIAGRMTHPWF